MQECKLVNNASCCTSRGFPSALPKTRIERKAKKNRFSRLLFYLFPLSRLDHGTPPRVGARILSLANRPRSASTFISRDMHIPHSPNEHPLDILIHNDPVVIHGTGVDYEPTTVRGVVTLFLPEATDIKEVMVCCTGKARLAILQKDGTRSQHHTNILYLKEDDLLQGDKSHPHTLKAGRHEFPFAFELDASCPASLSANFGMAVIQYRLRALAVRPSFSTNYIASKEFTLVRSFTNEALEFQQTLDIENTWPDKIQYCVILPHKAWAASDNISAILKFTPLAKGVKVVSINMVLQEKVKTVWKASTYEETRVVCSKKQTFRHGRPTQQPLLAPSRSNTDNPSESEALHMTRRRRSQQEENHHGGSFFRRVGSRVQSRDNLLGMFRGGTRTGEDSSSLPSTPANAHTSPPNSPRGSQSSSSTNGENESEDVELIMQMPIPTDATPSHDVGPVFISHRIKWDVLISNLDGHYSELRCSLPVHLLAKEVLDETLVATNANRTALLGENHGVLVQEIVLPAYQDHLRDRVAIDELYAHTLANNPLNALLPPTPSDEASESALAPLSSSYGQTSTLSEHMRTSSVPRIASMPDASERGRLRGTPDIGNISLGAQSTELYLSLGRRPSTTNSCTNAQLPGIGGGSLPPSQSSSRASSPERMGDTSNRSSRHNFGIKPFTTVFKSKSKTSTPSSSRPGSSHRTNNNNNNNKNPSAWPGAGSHKFSLSRSSSGPSTPSPEPTPQTLSSSIPTPSTTTSTSPPLGYYDAVPEYSFAALGFLGGGITPLSSLRGLPSYDQAERSRHNLPTNSAGTPSDINRLTGGRSRSGTRSSRPSVERTSRGRSRSGGSPPRRLSEDQQGP